MKIFFITASLAGLWTLLVAQEATSNQENKRPFMVSLTDLKWVEVPERKGMQFAISRVIPGTGPIRRCVKSAQALITGCILIAARSRT